ncbi:MAG: antitoxin family protein [archaeon GB-1867-035]|nr:antitoxin family protein [Candidatus Culexmicrobium profundum]
MIRIVEAVYENGVLKLLEKLGLREGQRVRVRIEESIVDIVRRYRDEYRVELSTEDIESYLAERR